jgi:hypothetical protein
MKPLHATRSSFGAERSDEECILRTYHIKLGDVNEGEKIGERHSLSDRKQFMSVYGDRDGAGAYCVLLPAAFSDSQCSRARLGVHGTAGSPSHSPEMNP